MIQPPPSSPPPVAPPVAASPPPGRKASAKPASPPRAAQNRKPPFHWFGLRSFLEPDGAEEDMIVDEADTIARYKRLAGLVRGQTLAMGILACIMVFGAPVMRPVYKFHGLTPDRKTMDIIPLYAPNLTTRSILSWTANSVTEILTLGFGDFDRQLIRQRNRFTSEGWTNFVEALVERKIKEAFKQRQLLLTTVPTDMPVIIGQGEDKDGEYVWQIEVPIIMTYATNNNVTKRERHVIRLTIVRVSGRGRIGGMAIKTWKMV